MERFVNELIPRDKLTAAIREQMAKDGTEHVWEDMRTIPMDELVDKEKELARLNKEKAAVQKDIDFSSNKLNNAGFVAKAPAQQVEAEKAKLAKAQEKMAKIEQSIAALMK